MSIATTSHPAPYAVRTWYPVYDGRDAICGAKSRHSRMRYGTVAGALAAARIADDVNDGELHTEVVDVRTGEVVSREEINAAIAHACEQNCFVGFFYNDKDGLPF
jgi:hypothetical protein